MVFSSLTFLQCFLPLCLLAYFLVPQKWRNGTLFLFSLLFYAWGEPVYVVLMLFSTALDYTCGQMVERHRGQRGAKIALLVSLCANLGLLGVFKYSDFLIGTVNSLFGTALPQPNLPLPIGISFYTFQTMSYTIDVYRKEIQPLTSLLDYAFYVSFFPQLVAGPIVRARDFIPQIRKPLFVSQEMFGRGIFLILSGLFKKAIISDYISINFVERIFDNPTLYSGVENLMGVYGYALQIYCDFSGYSDMAIGIALLLGFHFNLNFNSPYKSASITEFWRRWHISLSSWLRDYLYISLGGNRRGKIRTYFNLFITMVLGGLWHGASWLFVIWGAWHGVLLIVHKVYRRIFPVAKDDRPGIIRHFFHVLLTFHVVAAGWIFFRSPSLDIAGQILTQIFTNFRPEAIPSFVSGYAVIFVALVVGYLLHFAPHRWSQWLQRELSWSPLVVKAAILALVLFFVLQVRSSELVPFIYSQF